MILNYVAPNGQTINFINNPYFILSSADGLTETQISIAATDIANGDGMIINNVRAQPRGIVLYLLIPQGQNVEQVKRNVLTIVKPKQTGVLHWEYQERELDISATVEEIKMARYTQEAILQISLYCAEPYWQDAAYIVRELSLVDPLHHFELIIPHTSGFVMGVYNLDLSKAFHNDGDAAVGCIITIIATGEVTNPLLERVDGKYFGVNVSMQAGDEVVINTTKGHKSARKNDVNIMDKIKPGSTWFQLETGENIFNISEDGGNANMYFTFSYKQKYV